MKKIIFMLCLFLMVSCSKSYYTVYIDEGLSTKGIEAWGVPVKYVHNTGIGDFFSKPGIEIYLKVYKNNTTLGETFVDDDPIIIYIYYTNDVVIAHEFGHALGYKHNNISNSIMNPNANNLNKPLSWFKEFK